VKQYIGCDAHARYSVFVSVDESGKVSKPVRVDHYSRDLRDYLSKLEKDTPVAVEASGGWYWFMDELEAAGLDARLDLTVDPARALCAGLERRERPTRATGDARCTSTLY
jgi:hypothetical protein